MKNSDQLYIGLMSGTSIDGIDVALVDFSEKKCVLKHHYFHPIEQPIKNALSALSSPLTKAKANSIKENRIEKMAQLDVIMGENFAMAVNRLIKDYQIDRTKIKAIGTHGQTIRHRPQQASPFTLQIGDPNIIAERTGITTVADFRRMDIAAGGQGAPLAPAFHNAILRSEQENRFILNLGGIANITCLWKDLESSVVGFDTGPANTLMDAWFCKHFPTNKDNFDRDSLFAKTGQINLSLLNAMLKDPYFEQSYPKSTGREYFSLDWLEQHINQKSSPIRPKDVQRTLVELSVESIAVAIIKLQVNPYQVFACGGGMHNQFLLDELSKKLSTRVKQTNELAVDGDYLEAMTFAWLAKRRLEAKFGNLPSVTGASRPKILGALYLP